MSQRPTIYLLEEEAAEHLRLTTAREALQAEFRAAVRVPFDTVRALAQMRRQIDRIEQIGRARAAQLIPVQPDEIARDYTARPQEG